MLDNLLIFFFLLNGIMAYKKAKEKNITMTIFYCAMLIVSMIGCCNLNISYILYGLFM